MTAPSPRALVAFPARPGAGGLGTAAAEFCDGLAALGLPASYVGLQPRGALIRIATARPALRLLGDGPARRLRGRAVRRAVPRRGWQIAYAAPGSVPLDRGDGIRVIHQATRHPAIERAALRRGERETGGRGDLSAAELRRCLLEIDRADLIHVTSEAVRDEFLEAGVPAGRLVHAPLGVDVERYRPGPKPEQLTLAFVGPLSLRKGVDVVAELARRLRGRAVVETVGGPTCRWSRRVAEAAPFVRRDSVAEMLSGAHLFVLPSRSDGFSYAALEALASGAVPVVTPEVGAAEIVRRLDPRLVVARDGFAESVAELLPRLDLPALSIAARALAEQFDRRRASRELARAVLARAASLDDPRARALERWR